MVAEPNPSRLQNGWDRAEPGLRVYLAGEISVESGTRLVHERMLPGPRARHLLAFLAAEHNRALGHDEIAEELWGSSPPRALQSSLKALVSHTRAAISAAGLDGGALILGAPGVYRFRLPDSGWLDLDAARSSVHSAESLLAQARHEEAATATFVTLLITDRPLLPGRDGPWLQRARGGWTDLRIRALECSARAEIARGAPALAIRSAERAVELSPLREPGWRLLMDAHAAAGDIASALATYARCRAALADALGIGPSAATREQHRTLLARAG